MGGRKFRQIYADELLKVWLTMEPSVEFFTSLLRLDEGGKNEAKAFTREQKAMKSTKIKYR